MNSEQCQNFSDQVTQNLTLNHTPLSMNTTESLETTWHKIQTSIINAALQHIPYKKFKVRNFQYNFSSKATKLHYNFKKFSNIIRQIKIVIKNQTSIPLHLNQNINYINTQHQVNITLLPTTYNLLPNWISTTNLEWKALFHARNIENTKEIRQQINNAISKRCNKLATNPTSMINSILNRYKDPVKFNNINTDTSIITEPHSIKDHIRNHFDQWTHTRNINYDLYNTHWKAEYNPKSNINIDWYNNILEEFTLDEVSTTLCYLSNNKAYRPSGISYEIIKYTEFSFLQAITALFNRCLTQQSIPKQWKEERIFSISKKPIFDGDLSNTRPISLLEHIKKLYTKLLTNCLNHTFTQHKILSPYNFIALPGNSTLIPIYILNNIIKDALCNSSQLWLISQDMSKAYDSVNFDLFHKFLARIQMPIQLINILTNLLFDPIIELLLIL